MPERVVNHLQGYIHCMPKGNESFVMRLSPLQPGMVMTVCAEASVARLASVTSTEENILALCLFFFFFGVSQSVGDSSGGGCTPCFA